MKYNNVEVVTYADLANANHDINQIATGANTIGRKHYGNVHMAIVSDDKHDNSVNPASGEDRVIFISKGFMAPWTKVGQHESVSWDAAKKGTVVDISRSYSMIFPNFDYETGLAI